MPQPELICILLVEPGPTLGRADQVGEQHRQGLDPRWVAHPAHTRTCVGHPPANRVADERELLREVLLAKDEPIYGTVPLEGDDELVDNRRRGVYPYRNLMRRTSYETQKYQLQVELLKLQAWTKETGQRVVILFEGRDAAGKGGTITRFMEHVNPRGAPHRHR